MPPVHLVERYSRSLVVTFASCLLLAPAAAHGRPHVSATPASRRSTRDPTSRPTDPRSSAPASLATQCYFRKLGVKAGPFTMSRIQAMIITRQLDADTEVNCGGRWVRLGPSAAQIKLRKIHARIRMRQIDLMERYDSASTMRTAGIVVTIVGSLSGLALTIGGIVHGASNLCIGECDNDQTTGPVLFFTGIAVGFGSLVSGLILWASGASRMRAVKKKLPNVNLAFTPKGGAASVSWRF